MSTFKTPKGTELPFLNLRGKEYLQVAYRIVWFREEHPFWPIKIEIEDKTDKFVTCKATVCNEKGDVIQEAHKTEHFAEFHDALEKAETGAIGRALANMGYGTAYAQEILSHEGDDIEKPKLVDTPLVRTAKEVVEISKSITDTNKTVPLPKTKPAIKPLPPLKDECEHRWALSKFPDKKTGVFGEYCTKGCKATRPLPEDNIPF